MMIQHNIKLAFRNFKRHKGTFLINLTGLSTGLACTLLIFMWVQDEWSFDKFHANGNQLYRVMANHQHTDVTNTQPDVPGLLAPALKAEFPEVEMAVSTSSGRTNGSEVLTFTADNKSFKAPARFGSQDFFKMFSYPLVEGTNDQVLADKSAAVISVSLANKMFGSPQNAMGKSLDWEANGFKGKAAVSGVFQDVPANSSEVFDVVMSFDYFEKDMIGKYAHWTNYYAYSYLTLKQGTDLAAFNQKIKNFMRTKVEESNITLFASPYSDNYLYGKYVNTVQSGGRIEYVRLFSLIALFILVIACINFMNLATARSSQRGKEVGIKKAVGASRPALMRQFMGESMLMVFAALGIALLLVVGLLPKFNMVTGKQLALHFDSTLLLPMLGITVLTGLVAGSYPAFYLSNFNPLSILKGKVKAAAGETWIRKGLVVFQFGISLVLIIGVVIIYRQVEFVQTKNLGMDKDNVLSFELLGKANENRETFLAAIQQIPGVVRASTSGFQFGQNSWTQGIEWEGKAPDADFTFREIYAGEGVIETLGIPMAEGRSFSREFGTEQTGIIFNETAIKLMGLKNPVGKTIHHYSGDKQIVGVVKDFHFTSLHEAIRPLFFLYRPDRTTQALVKIAAGKERETLAQISAFYTQFNPGSTFNYTFIDDDYQALYQSEQRVALLSRFFAGLAVLISCLGLFGLATFTAEQRTREIGIRKVLGASVASITGLLAKDFLKLVIVAIVIASPVAWYFMQKWLSDFAYRIDIQWWMFAIAGAAALLIAFLTVGFQSVKAALMNPVKSLRSE